MGISEVETIKAIALNRSLHLELNLHKLHSLLRIADSEPMTDAEIRDLGLVPGFIAPVAPNDKVRIRSFFAKGFSVCGRSFERGTHKPNSPMRISKDGAFVRTVILL
ncbi:YbaK/proline--tRNA ligase associated domain protein [Leptospira santarosai str. HAI134]|nr:YbaK/proline--tRNA ligase associated domain protein [Leptospira santarosai str. HAI134]